MNPQTIHRGLAQIELQAHGARAQMTLEFLLILPADLEGIASLLDLGGLVSGEAFQDGPVRAQQLGGNRATRLYISKEV